MTFRPYQIGTGTSQHHQVDLVRGTERRANFVQSPSTESWDRSVAVGEFDATLHGVERVGSVTDSPHRELFGPRTGYGYLQVDLSATRTSDEMIGQGWSLAVNDGVGHAFSCGQIYQDVYDLNGPTLSDLAVGESLSNTTLPFPVTTGSSTRSCR